MGMRLRWHCFVSPRGYSEPDEKYRSRFGWVWWFWIPEIHTQPGDQYNPRVIRVIWLCIACGVDIWRQESRQFWPP